MGAYKCNVVVVIIMGAYIHGVLTLCGCLSRFYGILHYQLAAYLHCVLNWLKQTLNDCACGERSSN